MANTRPLRYGGVMNSGFPTPPPGVFDDEPPGWTNNAAADVYKRQVLHFYLEPGTP